MPATENNKWAVSLFFIGPHGLWPNPWKYQNRGKNEIIYTIAFGATMERQQYNT